MRLGIAARLSARLSVVVAVAALTSAAAARPFEPQSRADLEAKLAPVVCKTGRPAALPLEAWQHGIYDAQIEGELLRRVDGKPADLAYAASSARSIARVVRYRGLATGHCPNGAAFAVATPSAKPLTATGTRIELPVQELAGHCREWRVDYAAAQGGQPKRLTPTAATVETKMLKPGVISVTCQPESPRWQGPVQWFMYPVGAGPTADVPASEALAEDSSKTLMPAVVRAALIRWTNRVRAIEGLLAVAPSTDLDEQGELLSIDGKLTHNRTLLTRTAALLQDKKLRLLGENRVKGGNVHELAWLLWHSPRHRELLLSPSATSIGVGVKKIGAEVFAVLVLGQGSTANVSIDGGTPSPTRAVRR